MASVDIALTDVTAGHISWQRLATRLLSPRRLTPSGRHLGAVVDRDLLLLLREEARTRANEGTYVQRLAWSKDTIWLLAANAVVVEREWHGMPWWPEMVEAVLERDAYAWARPLRDDLIANPRRVRVETLDRLVEQGFTYDAAEGQAHWFRRPGVTLDVPG